MSNKYLPLVLCALVLLGAAVGALFGISFEKDRQQRCTNPQPLIRLRGNGLNFEVHQCSEGLRVIEEETWETR